MKVSYYIGGSAHTALKHFAQQLGVGYAVANGESYQNNYAPYVKPWDYMLLREIKRDLSDFGMDWTVLEGVGFLDRAKLGLEGRDEDIAHFCTLLENMSKLGIRTVCYNWMPVWNWFRTRVNVKLAGDARVTGFVAADIAGAPDVGVRIGKDQLWSNLEYFLKKVVPVAEKCRVQLAVHPDDPPVDEIAGVERILTSAEAMRQVTRLVPSEMNGITLCQGTFAAMGEDVPSCIRAFGREGKLFFAHFRDIAGTRDNFHETFHHNGMTDMAEAMKAYYEVGYQGSMRPDHVPTLYGEESDMPAYAINGNLFATGYMFGLMEAIEKQMAAKE